MLIDMNKKRSEFSKAGKDAVGQRLATIRKEKGLTQVELAEKAGLTQVQISHYEGGRSRMSMETIAKVSEVLEVPADVLLGLKQIKTNGKKPPKRLLKRLEQIEQLPKRDQQALIRTIDTYLKKAS